MNSTYIFSDIYWVFWRDIKKFAQQKARIMMLIVQPLVWLVLMGNSMTGLTRNPVAAKMLGTGNYLAFMTPGIMIMTALFGGVFGGTSILWDRRLGFLNKMLSAPIHRAAIPLGKLASIGLQSMMQAFLIALVSVLLGVHFITGIPGIIALVFIAGIFGMIMAGISLALAANLKSIESLMAISNFLTMPLMLTSNAMFPISAMPSWLSVIARVNPLSYAVSAMRTIAQQGWLFREIWLPVLMLLIIAMITISISVKMFYRSVS
jgi:ABC-2 type transport system permease protein